MHVKRSDVVLNPNNERVLFRPFELNDAVRVERIISRVLALSEEQAERLLAVVLAEFHNRHHRLQEFFLSRFSAISEWLPTDRPISDARKMLIGAYFTQEYALESAALFNPSIVAHPDQTNVPDGYLRFVLSLRATGEGHISSICFRSGVVSPEGRIELDDPTGFVTAPDVIFQSKYDKSLFRRKLAELGIVEGIVAAVLPELGDTFSLEELEREIRHAIQRHPEQRADWRAVGESMLALARSNYEIQCAPDSDISERIIFPSSPTETNGIEDARFVRFTDDDGSVRYCATYTAYDGRMTFPQMLETEDFLHFRVMTLNGPEVRNKGMALFPRRINGQYAMLSRQDGENLYLMYSDMLHFWYTRRLLMRPTEDWEFVQIGNCGSPIETEAGWLVLTHGVGPMRKYSIGAALLDLEDPSRVIGRLSEPLLSPNENEREGYVPNVVYSCGALIHNGNLILPYAMSDYASGFATVDVDELLAALRA